MAGWRSIFWVNVPVGLAVWLGSRWVPEVGADRGGAAGKAASRKVDWPGTVLCVAMTGALTLALLQGNTWGWASPVIVSLLAGSVVLLIIMMIFAMMMAGSEQFIEALDHYPWLYS